MREHTKYIQKYNDSVFFVRKQESKERMGLYEFVCLSESLFLKNLFLSISIKESGFNESE
jgi:hypothetical protein